MRSKREIECQLEHFKVNCLNRNQPETATWIEALEWVLGDAEHRAAYDTYIKSLHELAHVPAKPTDSIPLVLKLALERLK